MPNDPRTPPAEEICLKILDISALNCDEFREDNSVANTFYFGLDSIMPDIRKNDVNKEELFDLKSWDDLSKRIRKMNKMSVENKQISIEDIDSFFTEYIEFNNTLKQNIRKFHSNNGIEARKEMIKEYEKNIEELRKLIRKGIGFF